MSVCPDDAAIEAFARGDLPPDQADAVAAHLEACQACWRKVEARPAEAALADDLKWVSEIESETVVDINVPLARLNSMLPDYEIVAELGRGGMGIVFEARHLKLDRRVALKVLPALLGVVRPDAIVRFRREAALAARLKHNNIIAVYDFDEVDGTLFYAMELVEGQSLRAILQEISETGAIDVVLGAVSSQPSAMSRKDEEATRVRATEGGARTGDEATSDSGTGGPESASPTSEIRHPKLSMTRIGSSSNTDRAYYRRVAKWIAEVAEALHYAHGMDVVHRDVKPSNLLLNRHGRLLISDFGLAKAASVGTPSGLKTLTTSRSLLGTARYMSPEQVDENAEPIDHRVDVYGLGATLYELLAFRPMFAAADDREVLNQVLNKEPVPPHRFVRQVPRELETICLKAVEKDRTARYDTALALRDDLERWLLDLPIHARRPSLTVRTAKFVRRRKVPVALVAIVGVLLLVSGLIYGAYSTARHESAESTAVARSRGIQVLMAEAESNWTEGNYNSALRKVEQVLAQQPESKDAQVLRARILRHLDRDEEALRCLHQLVERDPDFWPAHYVLALAYRPEALPDGRTYHAPGEPVKLMSKEELERRFHYHQEQLERLNPDTAGAYFLRALAEQNPEKSNAWLNKALELDPGHLASVQELANRHARLGHYEAMLNVAERAAGIRPNWWIGHSLRGRALGRLGRREEAITAFDRAIALAPPQAMLLTNRAQQKLLLGRYDEAVLDASEAIRLDPVIGLAYAVRGSARAELGDFAAGLEDYSQAIRWSPRIKELYVSLADIHRQVGRWRDMVDDGTRTIELDPGYIRGYYDRGLAYLHLGEYAKAIKDLTRPIELEPADSTHLLLRGMAFEIAGSYDEAMADYERVIAQGDRNRGYALLGNHILAAHAGNSDTAADVLAKLDFGTESAGWVDRLVDLFAGRMSADGLLESATSADQQAEAYYYIGRRAQLAGDVEAAQDAFAQCVALKRHGVLETAFAWVYLKRLEQAGRSASASPKDLTATLETP